MYLFSLTEHCTCSKTSWIWKSNFGSIKASQYLDDIQKRIYRLQWWEEGTTQGRFFCFSSPVDATATCQAKWFYIQVSLLFFSRLSQHVCLPAAARGQLGDRAQGAEGPLGAAVRQSCWITGGKTKTDFSANRSKNRRKKNMSNCLNYRSDLILKKLLKEELPLLPRASSFSRF